MTLLTSGEAARLLGVSTPTVVRAVHTGKMRAALVTPGHHLRFDRDEVLAYRARLIVESTEGLDVELHGVAARRGRALDPPSRRR